MIAPRLPRWLWRWFRNDHHWETLSFFRDVPIFQGLTRRQLGRVMMAMQRRPYRAGEILFEEGQLGRAVYILKSGKVELSRKSGGARRVLSVLTPGQMFGEMALLEQMQRTASATVIEDGEIYLLYTATLDTLIRQHPNIGVVLLRNTAAILSALLRRANQELDHRVRPAA
jgi:CRP/FNR family transcriptional regulator